MYYDLILKKATVIDPSQDIFSPVDVAINKDKIACLQDEIPASQAKKVLDVEGKVLMPGLVDLHTHAFWRTFPYGVEPNSVCQQTGVTTIVDAGSAGAANFAGFRHFVIEPSPFRIKAFLNISYIGMLYQIFPNIPRYELHDIRFGHVKWAIQVIEENKGLIVGIKVRLFNQEPVAHGVTPLRLAIEVGEATNLPVMVHIDDPPPFLDQILALLRKGDIVTHCFRGDRNCILSKKGKVRSIVKEARGRGILMDVGQGEEYLNLKVARIALEQDFYPDTISTDLTPKGQERIVYDLPTTMSTFLALGMDLKEIVARTTLNPAEIVHPDGQLGSVRVGSYADIAVFELSEGEFEFEDSSGNKVMGDRKLTHHLTICNGQEYSKDKLLFS